MEPLDAAPGLRAKHPGFEPRETFYVNREPFAGVKEGAQMLRWLHDHRETSKPLVMQAAWMKNESKRNTRETSIAKWHATDSVFKAAHLAIQVHGSYGYSAEYGIERYFRNARADHLREHHADPQDDAGRARARRSPPEALA